MTRGHGSKFRGADSFSTPRGASDWDRASAQRNGEQFIRWYYGYFQFDRTDEVYSFGAVRSRGAQRLGRVLKALWLTRFLRP
jgi:hypothetical protein